MGAGRPTSYKPEYCELLEEHFREGRSYSTFASVVNVHRDTLYQWEKDHPEFSDTKKRCIAHSEYWWEAAGMKGMFMGGKDNPFNATVWCMNMKNRFGWRSEPKEENSESGKVVINYTKVEK